MADLTSVDKDQYIPMEDRIDITGDGKVIKEIVQEGNGNKSKQGCTVHGNTLPLHKLVTIRSAFCWNISD